MNSKEVYAMARRAWGPWLKASGFRRGADHAGAFIQQALWCKPLPDNGDPASPDRLIVSLFVRAGEKVSRVPGNMTCELEVGRAARYSQVLTPAERETIRLRQHKVVDKVRLPAVAEQFHRTAESAGDPRDDTWLLLMDETMRGTGCSCSPA